MLTSKRGARISLAIVLAIFTLLFGVLTGASAPSQTATAPTTSESTQVSELLSHFPDAAKPSLLAVVTRDDGAALTESDLASLGDLESAAGSHADSEIGPTRVSEDGKAAVLVIPVAPSENSTDASVVVESLRADLGAATPEGLSVLVTGGSAFGADIAAAFNGANFTLLAVTILIVAILLIATYRSPVLWLIPLLSVALADGLAGRAAAAAGEAWNLQFDAGIISVLVFGAGTNYALLLISRYREELTRHENHRIALAAAWRATLPAIVASNLTVVLALSTLLFAAIPVTRGIGIPAAIGLAIALGAVLFLLPPLLAMAGRRAFWPFIPRPGEKVRAGRAWRGLAGGVSKRPARSLVAGLALLAVTATGLIGTTVGLSSAEKFRVNSESADGLEVLAEHFPAGEAQPIFVITNSGAADEVAQAIREAEGIVRAVPLGTSRDGALTQLMVTSEYAPSSAESLAQIDSLRSLVRGIDGADALVGGATATDVDARAGTSADLWLIAPLVLAVSFLVLLALLRSLIAPVLLLGVNIASALAAIGAGAWLGRIVFDQPSLDLQVPLLAFLFLVALGIDYTIFLVHRARLEAQHRGTRAGMVEAVAHTGSVITSAGLVLAGVFAALGVLPLVTLGQLGLIVGIGVIVDTLVVRTIIVPAIFALAGDRIWWPTQPVRINVPDTPALAADERVLLNQK